MHLGRSTFDDSVVALKIMRSELSKDLSYVDMFRDEASILSRMRHPNIVETLEFGVSGEHSYIAMELLLGRTLSEVWDAALAQERPLPARLVAWIGARVASALHYAHTLPDEWGNPLRVVHRDANPSNIVLTDEGAVKLIDFGLAKAARRAARTEDGIVKGKVPYLAPEQILEEDVDGRTDIFTLGASLWECLAMRRLFKRETDLETIRAIRDGVVPDLAEVAPQCPAAVATIVSKCLERDRLRRFYSAHDLEVALGGAFEQDAERNERAVARLLMDLFPGEREERVRWRTERFAADGAR